MKMKKISYYLDWASTVAIFLSPPFLLIMAWYDGDRPVTIVYTLLGVLGLDYLERIKAPVRPEGI